MLVSATLTLALGLSADRTRRDGLFLGAAGLAVHTLAYVLFALRGTAPEMLSIVVPNVLLSASFALFGEGLCQFQARPPDRRLLWLPVLAALLAFSWLADALPARLLAGPAIFGLQILTLLLLILRERRATVGRGQYFLFAGLAALLPVLGLRAGVALGGELAIADFDAPHVVQALSYMTVLASTLLVTLGYVLMCKEGADHQSRLLAMIDELTGLPNRRSTLQGLARCLEAARRSGQPLTVLMLDVDHFKTVNDLHGHPVGDAALRRVAQALRSCLRAQDLLGRVGGEEFLAVMPGALAAGEVLQRAEELRAAVAANPLAGPRPAPIRLTVSIGVATVAPGQSCSLQAVISAADRALYRAKGAGRDRLELARAADFEQLPAAAA